MGSWWRSEDMTYVSLIISEDAAPACVRELGILGCLQFVDLNPELTPFQRRYVAFVKRCDEIERKIRYVHGEIKKLGVEVQPAGTVQHFVESSAGQEANSGSFILDGLEMKLQRYEQQLIDLGKYGVKLTEEYNAKLEYHHVLQKTRSLFMAEMTTIEAAENVLHSGFHNFDRSTNGGVEMKPLKPVDSEGGAAPNELAFQNVAGVIYNVDRVRFERMLFRATRGNCWVRFVDIEDAPRTTAVSTAVVSTATAPAPPAEKAVFIIFFKSHTILGKIKKICDAFGAHRYDIPSLDRPGDLETQQRANEKELAEAKDVLDRNVDMRTRLCSEAALSIEEWLWVVRREKGVYHVLNCLKNDIAGNVLRGRGWILTSAMDQARASINRVHVALSLPPSAMLERVPEIWPTAPTHFVTNQYSDAFQEFVNTYGIPRYREINPALFTAATFPFLFGIMYGDIGHGSCLLTLGLILILTEKHFNTRSAGEMLKGMYSARYMLTAMGACAIYAGTIYNDYFSLGLNIFGSNFLFKDKTEGASAVMLGTYGDPNSVYPYGVDPAWKISNNNLLFFNSLKMKLSVILGITQMTLGIVLRGINAYYFRQWLDIFCEFIPMMIFNSCFFIYMVILIFVKWSINWNHRMALGSCAYDVNGNFGACTLSVNTTSCYTFSGSMCDASTQLVDMCPLGMGGTSNGCQPPNLITTLMNMALQPGYVDEPMFAGQAGLQSFLLVMAFLSVPWLLCVKPYILKEKHNKEQMLLKQSQAAGMEIDDHHAHHSDDGAIENPLLQSLGAVSASAEPGNSHTDLRDVGEMNLHHGGGEKDHGHAAGGDHHGEFNFGEIVIHQAIETIEFVLGMVSNTASYLRLWALSLAHSELAEVFWDKALLGMVVGGNPAGIYVGYAVFAAVTFAVLLCMDVLECFLHALRLHWVEFQNKFFKADGHRFQPFDFKSIISKALLE